MPELMAKPVILNHLPRSEEWPLQVVGALASGGGTPFVPPPVLLCDLGACGDILCPGLDFLTSQFLPSPTKS